MRKYLFRDKEKNISTDTGVEVVSRGIIHFFNAEIGKPSYSGKDVTVIYFCPFDAMFHYEWRAFKDIEMIEIEENVWQSISDEYERLSDFQDSQNNIKDGK